MYWSMVFLPRRWASWMVPTLDEAARMSAVVHHMGLWGSASWNTPSDTLRLSGTFMRVDGSTRCSSRAAATVTTLLVEPGSKTRVTAMLSAVGVGGAPAVPACRLAMARISPVWGSLTTAMPPLAFDDTM